MPTEPLLFIPAVLLVVAATAAAATWLLRGAGIAGGRPAAAIVGGILAGTLLGPAVLGRVAPDVHDHLFRAGTAERQALRHVLSRHAADRAAATMTGAPPAAVAELFTRHSIERAPLDRALRLAVAEHRRRLCGAGAVLLAVGLLLASWAGRTPTPSVPATVMALAAVVAEVAVIGAAAHLLLRAPIDLAVAAGAAGAGGSIFVGLPLRWIPRRGRSPLARSTGAAMFILALIAVLAVARGAGIAAAAVLLAAPLLGWGLRLATGRAMSRPAARGALLWVALPTAAAAVALHVEWRLVGDDTRALLAVPLLVLLSGNAAFAGLWLAGKLGRHTAGRMDTEALLDWQSAGFGPTQVCVVLAILAAGVADPLTPIGSAVLAGLLLSAAIGETALSWLRHALREAEQRDPQN